MDQGTLIQPGMDVASKSKKPKMCCHVSDVYFSPRQAICSRPEASIYSS